MKLSIEFFVYLCYTIVGVAISRSCFARCKQCKTIQKTKQFALEQTKMIKKDKVQVTIGGRSFYLISDESPEYLTEIAKKVNRKISGLLRENIGISFEQAAVLAAIKYCDDFEKKARSIENEKKEDENLGKKLVQYSKELTRATARIKAMEKEMAKMKKEQEKI